MELPDDVLAIIKDYAQPVTRPGWRKLHKMPSYRFHRAVLIQYNSRPTRVVYKFVTAYTRCPQDIYKYSFDPYMDWDRRIIKYRLSLINDYHILK